MSSSSMHKLKQNENVSTRGKHGGKSHSDTSAPFSSEQLGKHQCARALPVLEKRTREGSQEFCSSLPSLLWTPTVLLRCSPNG